MDPALEPIINWLHRQEPFLLGIALVLIVGSTLVYLGIAILRFALFLLRHAAKDLGLLRIEMRATISEFKKTFAKKDDEPTNAPPAA